MATFVVTKPWTSSSIIHHPLDDNISSQTIHQERVLVLRIPSFPQHHHHHHHQEAEEEEEEEEVLPSAFCMHSFGSLFLHACIFPIDFCHSSHLISSVSVHFSMHCPLLSVLCINCTHTHTHTHTYTYIHTYIQTQRPVLILLV